MLEGIYCAGRLNAQIKPGQIMRAYARGLAPSIAMAEI